MPKNANARPYESFSAPIRDAHNLDISYVFPTNPRFNVPSMQGEIMSLSFRPDAATGGLLAAADDRGHCLVASCAAGGAGPDGASPSYRLMRAVGPGGQQGWAGAVVMSDVSRSGLRAVYITHITPGLVNRPFKSTKPSPSCRILQLIFRFYFPPSLPSYRPSRSSSPDPEPETSSTFGVTSSLGGVPPSTRHPPSGPSPKEPIQAPSPWWPAPRVRASLCTT